MIYFIIFILLIIFILACLYIIYNEKLVDSNQFIKVQITYFIQKVLAVFAITYFFCFFSPTNSSKLILSSLMIFIVFHFLEAVVIQKKINMKDFNG